MFVIGLFVGLPFFNVEAGFVVFVKLAFLVAPG